jgi:hypothetical protein
MWHCPFLLTSKFTIFPLHTCPHVKQHMHVIPMWNLHGPNAIYLTIYMYDHVWVCALKGPHTFFFASSFFLSFWLCWVLTQGLMLARLALNILMNSASLVLCWLSLRCGLLNYLPGLPSNHDHPDLFYWEPFRWITGVCQQLLPLSLWIIAIV